MRITYVLPRPELGGGNKVIFQHAELLRRRGHGVTILGEGPAPSWTRLRMPYHDLGHLPSMPGQDLVITTFWTTMAKARELDLGPLAHFCQGYEGWHCHYAHHHADIEAAYSRPHPNLTVTPYLSEFLEERFGNPGQATPPPLDRTFRPRWRRSFGDRPWIVVPGVYAAPVKGVETALSAIDRLRDRGLDCRVLRVSTVPLCDAERERHTPDDFLSGVDPKVIAERLPRCDLVLMPSEPEEGFGLPMLEAMASGVPAVASDIPSTRFMADGCPPTDRIDLVPVGDADAFADAAWPLLTDPKAWRRARRRGLRAVEPFVPEAIADRLEQGVRWASRVARD